MSIRPEDATSWWPWEDPWPPGDFRSERRQDLYEAIRRVQDEHGPIVSETKTTLQTYDPDLGTSDGWVLTVEYQDGHVRVFHVARDAPDHRRGLWRETGAS